jgi:hypothetical protein
MDQRGYSVDPPEVPTPRGAGFPAPRLRAWAGLAARSSGIVLVPAQRERDAA